MPDTIRAADALARRLYAAGCRTAFGMPGGEVLTVIDALEAAGIRFILAKHENAAGFMAEAVHHRDHAPAILIGTIGPGTLNGVNTVANALQDQVPLIVISGCMDADEAQRYTHQLIDHQAVFAPVTKATFRLNAGAAHTIADKAVAIATEGRMGPVHIDVPISVADAPVNAQVPVSRAKASPAVPDGSDLATARDWLEKAQRPVMIVGVDAMNQNAGKAVVEFAEDHNIPVITTYKAKGILPEDHALSLGGAGLSPLADTHLLPFVRSADLILCVGYDPIEMRPGWRDVWAPTQQNVIDISAVPNHHYMHQATLNFITDCAATLHALSDGLDGQDTWPDGEIPTLKQALSASFPRGEDWGPAAIIDTCRNTLPRNTIASADSGAHRILLSQMWECYAPRDLMQSSALCTMGCAVPMAIGAKLAAPDRPVVSFSGDAGFLMVAGELATAAELDVSPIFVVFVDASLALIEKKQRERQLRNLGVDFAQHNFAAMGVAFGGVGVTVRSRAALETALQNAMQAETFTVIAAIIDQGAYDGRI
ncbi:thiamine pyrophosphate-binding protein [Sulfitobacter sp. M57]|uniref:thiamine pyrophosphate-binding protein n=1 Tax=unclassified Sulfitobacter TaxID=196795 RepID=UPI0023E09841|nr:MULTISPECIES: thiamine pyrophosphate-binding protein [unclassified Sulfitobacter]MDF3415761.1 thiamine pyrophosphate-binding protein [Sulfitobacter sp. KE5]MDF3423241.1 thiamine pyrophosphate-binding protein [Sulfitobacter sp. KE43]MDF3434307.1 thiamine pyrophosphate-binding protein [Sulfitobacter sp. KE42]MDF3459660.1 thiamine pyrophosphate-binding protein [Sulfitobacter sp. S74]MDF3463845.1 thiamine pyrophosphate-binding protein [Sulfitobacter sp. Ks18]